MSVWGRRDKSPYFQVLPKILRSHGVEFPPARSYFHLGDSLAQVVKDAGFKEVKQAYVPVLLDDNKEEALASLLASPFFNRIWESISEGTKEDVEASFYKEYERRFGPKTQEMVQFEASVVIAKK